MKLQLCIDSKPLEVDIDDVIAALLAVRLGQPADADNREALAHYLSEKGTPWILDDEHMRKRIDD